MDGNEFYEELYTYSKRFDIQCTISGGHFTNERYASFGMNTCDVPSVLLKIERRIGVIDIYSVEFINTYQTITKEQKHFLEIIFDFLSDIYKEKTHGYVLYKKYKNNENTYIYTSQDLFEIKAIDNYEYIKVDSPIYPFVNTNSTEWAIFSKGKKVEESFILLLELWNSLLKFKDKENSVEVYDCRFINSTNLFDKFMFKHSDIQYTISILPSTPLLFELKISAYPNYFSVPFSVKENPDFSELVFEIEKKNCLHRLFEQKITPLTT